MASVVENGGKDLSFEVGRRRCTRGLKFLGELFSSQGVQAQFWVKVLNLFSSSSSFTDISEPNEDSAIVGKVSKNWTLDSAEFMALMY